MTEVSSEKYETYKRTLQLIRTYFRKRSYGYYFINDYVLKVLPHEAVFYYKKEPYVVVQVSKIEEILETDPIIIRAHSVEKGLLFLAKVLRLYMNSLREE